MDEYDPAHAPHILYTSSNLLGFAFIVLTSRYVDLAHATAVTKIAGGCVGLFAVSSLLSYSSIISKKPKQSQRREWVASTLFFTGLILLAIAGILLAFNAIQ